MTDKKYKYWLAVVDGQTVQFSELAHMMATALHPEGGMDYAAARINLEDELKLAVRDGLLRVRNPAGLGFHTFPHGDALQRAVLIPHTDLEPFLNERSIELRITPHGNGPDYWTLENAAAAMQEQLNWHDGTRAEFQDQMQEAAQSGALVILNPRTCLPPIRTERVRTYWEYVTPASVNAWLANLKAPYRWSPAPPLVTVPHKSPRDFKPWETLVPFFEPINGVYMYQQAAREIADGEGWDDSKLAAFESEMANAVNDGSLPIRSRKTGMVISPDSLDALALVTVDDVNEWLESKRVPYRWKLKTQPQAAHMETPEPQAAPDGVESAMAGPAVTAPAQGNSTKTLRSDSIDPVIEYAKTKCLDPKNTSQVWAQMQVLAQDEHAPFLASMEKGLKYHKKGKDAYFTRDALDKRLHPEKRGTPAKRR